MSTDTTVDQATHDELPQFSKKDFTSDQEVRWCPGCGDYAILATVQKLLADLGRDPSETVFVSGIGCSSRFPYYMDTYGIHSIHGRAPAIATGVASARPELDVWVITGDGDALSIGGNHLIHALRRNVDITILLFNNEIYGLTKGQYSPTSPLGAVHKSTPMGSIDRPLNPVSLALGAEATFVARTIDTDRNHLTEILTAANAHRGAALVEIYQNCVVFNDDFAHAVTDRETKVINQIPLRIGEPIVFGPEGEKAVVADDDGSMMIVPTAEAGDRIVVHDPTRTEPTTAFALSRLSHNPTGPTPLGIFRAVEQPVYDDLLNDQVEAAVAERGRGRLEDLLTSGNVWHVT
ncbi:2-oxoacid:ferredoxin oxidoreductase subunit beta [Salsipaludibacter albus]|uniref:2-oxoacid:ferredoxin oxidoreductase subunit beta n=1 Tax=Salsipaludibacter albus TaxID=2849650 RepID=UPI001EE3ABCF|nr:2-oxoacid:ferredoxin oxidoreductase subunit beta [Salsipaludibacter albus]MBY5163009.1 2-oxoacid:ferredoxin oxidoreductase subunit beta [Salsipaludibacter albus]